MCVSLAALTRCLSDSPRVGKKRALPSSLSSLPFPRPFFSVLFQQADKRAQCREKAGKAASASYLSLGAKGLSACRHITLRSPHTPARLNLHPF